MKPVAASMAIYLPANTLSMQNSTAPAIEAVAYMCFTNMAGVFPTIISLISPPPTPVTTPTNTGKNIPGSEAVSKALIAPDTVNMPRPIESVTSIRTLLRETKNEYYETGRYGGYCINGILEHSWRSSPQNYIPYNPAAYSYGKPQYADSENIHIFSDTGQGAGHRKCGSSCKLKNKNENIHKNIISFRAIKNREN
jgi:hypothetical protein